MRHELALQPTIHARVARPRGHGVEKVVRLCAVLLCAAALLPAATAPAQEMAPRDGLDTAWNGGGTALAAVLGYDVGYESFDIDRNIAVAAQPVGRIVLAGICAGASSDITTCMTRLLPGGPRDYSFGPGQSGAFAFSRFASWPSISPSYALLRQSDGRLVVTGASVGAGAEDNTAYASVVRLTADGTLDPSVPVQPVRFEFAHDAAAPLNAITAAAQQADGKLVVAGFTYAAGNPPNADFATARLRADLTLDPTFNGAGVRVAAFDLGGDGGDMARALAIQSDGKIVVAGTASTSSNGLDAAVLRLNANGTLDTSFGSLGRVTFDFGGNHADDVINEVKVDGAGRIWLAGAKQASPNSTNTDFLVARLRADGSPDTTFNGDIGSYKTVSFDLDAGTTQRETDVASSLLIQSDGKIVLAGSASNGDASGHGFDFAAVRLLSDGAIDASFGPYGGNGRLHGRFAATMPVNRATSAVFGGSGIVLAGYAANYDDDHDNTIAGQFGVAMIRIDRIFANGFER